MDSIDLDDLDLSALDLDAVEILTATDTVGTAIDGASSWRILCFGTPSCSCAGPNPT